MDQKEIAGLVSVVVLLLLVVLIIVLITVFMKRKNKLLEEQALAKKKYDEELARTQIEIREETLRNISWELHDNIGQLMTLAKIQAQMAQDKPEYLDEAVATIGNGIDELRALSKLINPEALKSLTLSKALEMEIERFNRLKFIDAQLEIEGTPVRFDANSEVIIFRILQEFFSNTIKHSRASKLTVKVSYLLEELFITAIDNGIGFQDSSQFSGIGIKNMKNRAQVINADLSLSSEKNSGTELKLKYRM
jgi:signal transduction histidine kinase